MYYNNAFATTKKSVNPILNMTDKESDETLSVPIIPFCTNQKKMGGSYVEPIDGRMHAADRTCRHQCMRERPPAHIQWTQRFAAFFFDFLAADSAASS
jgi:hypothetical protein